MNDTNRLIEKSDPRVVALFRRLEKVNSILDKLEIHSRRSFHGQRFITDLELAKKLRLSRRTLQQYRSAKVIPYYLICGKILYSESEVQKYLEDSRVKNMELKDLI